MKALDADFLHKACLFLSPFKTGDLNTELQLVVEFVKQHCHQHGTELAKALLFRVIESAPGSDSLGTWFMIDSVLKASVSDVALQTTVVDYLTAHLAEVVSIRWNKHSSLDGSGKHPKGEVVERSKSNTQHYSSILAGWQRLLSSSLYRDIVDATKNRLYGDDDAAQARGIPASLHVSRSNQEALWKLRRTAPRPSICSWLFSAYYPRQTVNDVFSKDLECLECHPLARKWMELTFKDREGYCAKCDTFSHPADKCPCDTYCIVCGKHHEPTRMCSAHLECAFCLGAHVISQCGKRGSIARSTLEQAGLSTAHNTDWSASDTIKVLDAVVQRLQQRQPVDQTLLALDEVRGWDTGPEARRALHHLAEHKLLPSKLDLDTAAQPSPAAERQFSRLHNLRRFGECKELERAVDLLHIVFIRQKVSSDESKVLASVWNDRQFLFATDGAPQQESNESALLRRCRGLFCEKCLSTAHRTFDCKIPMCMSWDHLLAKRVLDMNNLLGVQFPDDADKYYRVEEGLAGREREQLELAKSLLVTSNVPYCRRCKDYGHKGNGCFKSAREALVKHGYNESTCRLLPWEVKRKIRYLRDDREDNDASQLEAALQLVAAKPFPTSYGIAVEEFRRVGIPLAVVVHLRRQWDLIVEKTPSLQYLYNHTLSVRLSDFPVVCFDCSAIGHTCDDVDYHASSSLSRAWIGINEARVDITAVASTHHMDAAQQESILTSNFGRDQAAPVVDALRSLRPHISFLLQEVAHSVKALSSTATQQLGRRSSLASFERTANSESQAGHQSNLSLSPIGKSLSPGSPHHKGASSAAPQSATARAFATLRSAGIPLATAVGEPDAPAIDYTALQTDVLMAIQEVQNTCKPGAMTDEAAAALLAEVGVDPNGDLDWSDALHQSIRDRVPMSLHGLVAAARQLLADERSDKRRH